MEDRRGRKRHGLRSSVMAVLATVADGLDGPQRSESVKPGEEGYGNGAHPHDAPPREAWRFDGPPTPPRKAAYAGNVASAVAGAISAVDPNPTPARRRPGDKLSPRRRLGSDELGHARWRTARRERATNWSERILRSRTKRLAHKISADICMDHEHPKNSRVLFFVGSSAFAAGMPRKVAKNNFSQASRRVTT